MTQCTSGPMKWWWRVSLICLLNAVGITVLTEFVWNVLRGDPFLWRRLGPGPILFEFRGMGIILGLLTVGLPTVAGLTINRWLLERRFRRSLSAAIGHAWHSLGIWRLAWLNRSALAVAVVCLIGAASSVLWERQPISRLIGTKLGQSPTSKTALPLAAPGNPSGIVYNLGSGNYVVQAGNPPPRGFLIPPLLVGNSSPTGATPLLATPTIAVATWIQRTHQALLMTMGAFLTMVVFRILCLRGTPADGMLHCLRCDYILKGLIEPRCPECGEPI